ncbi:cupin domain-containing protein [Halomonas nitroreducens]|uniref:Cupin domain-containing protein n=1 Tax=Halomonas nitroreducens TaxID=447425 RepID=A0A3S0K5W1_9GAMM|nr:cupin domain-containing protein [Halomonas nitroreducens]RTR06541.1 cupin domain-containing protein [Halomonas nitroreducens]
MAMYLSAKEIDALAGVTKQHFLNPRAIRLNKSLGDAVGLKHLGVHLIHVAPGHYSTEYHAHLYEEECLYILAGRGLATLGDHPQAVGPGDFIGCPTNGVAHDLYNDGDAPLTCLVIGQRLDQDVSDYPRQGKRLYRNSGEWNLVDHAAIETLER